MQRHALVLHKRKKRKLFFGAAVKIADPDCGAKQFFEPAPQNKTMLLEDNARIKLGGKSSSVGA